MRENTLYDIYKGLLFNIYRYEQKLSELEQESKQLDPNQPAKGIEGGKAGFFEDILYFYLPDTPPFVKNYNFTNKERKTIRDRWRGYITRAYNLSDISLPPKYYDNAFVLIEVNSNTEAPWDADNLAYKYIIDGIKVINVIKNDDCRYFMHTIEGIRNKRNFTRVYVCHRKKRSYLMDICDNDKYKDDFIRKAINRFASVSTALDFCIDDSPLKKDVSTTIMQVEEDDFLPDNLDENM